MIAGRERHARGTAISHQRARAGSRLPLLRGSRRPPRRPQGIVRNLSDGSVEAVCEGDADAVARFELAVRQGPPGARVDDVKMQTIPVGLREQDFRIHD